MRNLKTSDNQEELYDVVDAHDQVIGSATRKEVHTNPALIHRAAGGFIFNSKRELLMQKRSRTKDMYPGYWVFSVGGHVDSGDTYDLAVKRELREELGIEIPLIPVEKILQKGDYETEFWMMYAGVFDGPFDHFNRTEIDELRFFAVADLINHAANGSRPMPPNVVRLLPDVHRYLAREDVSRLFT